jgi:hypothetical protein
LALNPRLASIANSVRNAIPATAHGIVFPRVALVFVVAPAIAPAAAAPAAAPQ